MTATSTTIDNGATHTAEDIHLGQRIVGHCLDALAITLSLAVASCFTAWWAMLIAFILAIIVAALFNTLAAIGMTMFVADDTFGALGASAFSVKNTVTGWFTSK